MTIRAKFKVDSIERQLHWNKSMGELHTIKLSPVTSGSEENKSFFSATPVGSIQLGVLNQTAGQLFELGEEYYVDFTKAEHI